MSTRLGAVRRARPTLLGLLASWLLFSSSATAQVLDTVIRLPGQPGKLVRNFNNRLYVQSGASLSSDSMCLFVIDCSTSSCVSAIPLGLQSGHFPRYKASDWRRSILYYSTPESGHVAVIDLRADSVVATLKFSGATWGMAYDSRDDRLYVCSRKLYAVNCSTRIATDSIPVLGEFFATWDSVDNKLYTGGGFNTDIVRVIDCATNTVKGVIHTRIGPSIEDVAYSPVSNRLYLGNEGDYFGGVIDCRSDAYTLLPEVGATVYPPVCNDLEGKAYWASEYPWYGGWLDSVTVMDMHDNSVLRKVPLERLGVPCHGFGGIGLAPWSNRLYFTWYVDDTSGSTHYMLSALDCRSDSIVGTIEAPTRPTHLYCNSYDRRIYITCYAPDSNVYVYRDEPAGGVEAPAAVAPVATLSVTPNPTSGGATVSAQAAAVDIYDAAGRLVRRLALNSGRATISGLAPGVYVLRAGAASAKLTVTD